MADNEQNRQANTQEQVPSFLPSDLTHVITSRNTSARSCGRGRRKKQSHLECELWSNDTDLRSLLASVQTSYGSPATKHGSFFNIGADEWPLIYHLSTSRNGILMATPVIGF